MDLSDKDKERIVAEEKFRMETRAGMEHDHADGPSVGPWRGRWRGHHGSCGSGGCGCGYGGGWHFGWFRILLAILVFGAAIHFFSRHCGRGDDCRYDRDRITSNDAPRMAPDAPVAPAPHR